MITGTRETVKRTVVGKVVSVKMNKTIVVQTERMVKHALYGKYLKRFSKMYAHDEKQECREGDIVMIKMARPISRTKKWVLDSIVTPISEAENPVTE